jgi:hypothetical protein
MTPAVDVSDLKELEADLRGRIYLHSTVTRCALFNHVMLAPPTGIVVTYFGVSKW